MSCVDLMGIERFTMVMDIHYGDKLNNQLHIKYSTLVHRRYFKKVQKIRTRDFEIKSNSNPIPA